MSETLLRRGHKSYVAGLPGFYVVNPTTNIGSRRYSTRAAAEREIQRVYADYPRDHSELVVVEIDDDERLSRDRSGFPAHSRPATQDRKSVV